MDIQLEVRSAGFGGSVKGGQRVFGVLAAGTAMGDYAGPGRIEEIAIQRRKSHSNRKEVSASGARRANNNARAGANRSRPPDEYSAARRPPARPLSLRYRHGNDHPCQATSTASR